MVKSQITESRLRNNRVSYPCLKKTQSGDILLMQDSTTGVVLISSGIFIVGDLSIAWNPATLEPLGPEEAVTVTFSNAPGQARQRNNRQ